MEKLRIGVIGLGFAGGLHVDAIRRIPGAEIVAAADRDLAFAGQRAEAFGIPAAYSSIEEMLAEGHLDVVHNCTPNSLHLHVNRAVIESGVNIFAEKPLALTGSEARELLASLAAHPEVSAGVNFCYRMNPMVQEMKALLDSGYAGRPLLAHGSYLQQSLVTEHDVNWHLNDELNGPSRAVADIGSHWMDLVQYLYGAKITAVCADLYTAYPVRKPIQNGVEQQIRVSTEDYGAVLFRMDNGVHGVFHVSEISAGHGNRLSIELNGSKASFYWNQEQPNQLWAGRKDSPSLIMDRDPKLLTDFAKQYTHIGKGHPEGWKDALYNNISAFYGYIRHGEKPANPPFATFKQAARVVKLVDAILESSRSHVWVDVE
jgi:predicted dehydrogenase